MVNYIVDHVETMVKPPFLSITMETPFTKWTKKCKEDGSINPYWKEVTKETTKTYLLVTNYEKRVNTNMSKEGIEDTHELGELKGRQHYSKSILFDTVNEKEFYLMVEQFDEIKPSETIYRHNGNQIDKMVFEKWLTHYDNYTSQQQDRKVQVMTPKLSNIKSIKVNGIKFNITH
jgi:hypothetical protein